MKKSMLVTSFLLSSAIFAHEKDSEFNIKSYVLTLEGTQAFGGACYLGVKEEGVSADGLYFAEVETSYSHGGSGPGVLRVTQDAKNPNLLTATKDDGTRISIELSKGGVKASDSLKYAVRWKHVDHFDSGLCKDLKVVYESPAEEEDSHHHEDEEIAEFDVESYLLTLKGIQPFGEACYLGVREEGISEEGLYFANVETSFTHDGSGAGILQVAQDKENPRLLVAAKEDGSRISIELSKEGGKISESLKYAVRWKHEGHYDSGLCNDLKVIHDANAENAGGSSVGPEISRP